MVFGDAKALMSDLSTVLLGLVLEMNSFVGED